MPTDCPRFALITPARNEAANIEKTLDSVVNQTWQPVRWIVVDDNSTDETGAIVERYARRHGFIRCLAAPPHPRKSFGAKVKAFEAGYAELRGCEYDFIGVLDGDVSFAPDYFQRLFESLCADGRLGLAGGIILEQVNDRFVPQDISLNSVAGAVQMFRRECFEQVGGFQPLELGGEDSYVEIMARMLGWETQTFPHLQVYHHGRVTMGGRSVLRSRFRKGRVCYSLGYHPLFQLATGLYRALKPPYVIGGALLVAGYMWAAVERKERQVPEAMVRFLRAEQAARLRIPGRARPRAELC